MERFAAALGVPPLSADEQERVLAWARDVAHGSERRYAPLTSFLLGLALGSSNIDRGVALEDAVSRLDAVLRDTPPAPPAS